MKIKVIGYPADFEFKTNRKLPPFDFGCPIRSGIVQNQLIKVDYDAPHVPGDFIVESVEKIKGGEIWHLGS